MSLTSYLIDSALVLLVLLQITEKPLSTHALLRPLIIVGVAVASYFTSLPTAGNDLVLLIALALLGLLLGTAAGQTTIVRRRPEDGAVTVRAGWMAGFLWVLGMGLRFAFAVWVSSHAGASAIGQFSAAHAITGAAAWTDALLAMVVAEVAGRTVVLAARRERARHEVATVHA